MQETELRAAAEAMQRDRLSVHAADVARDWLADHDPTPADSAWLDAALGDDGGRVLAAIADALRLDFPGLAPRTRGHVRSLARGLGLPLVGDIGIPPVGDINTPYTVTG